MREAALVGKVASMVREAVPVAGDVEMAERQAARMVVTAGVAARAAASWEGSAVCRP